MLTPTLSSYHLNVVSPAGNGLVRHDFGERDEQPFSIKSLTGFARFVDAGLGQLDRVLEQDLQLALRQDRDDPSRVRNKLVQLLQLGQGEVLDEGLGIADGADAL